MEMSQTTQVGRIGADLSEIPRGRPIVAYCT